MIFGQDSKPTVGNGDNNSLIIKRNLKQPSIGAEIVLPTDQRNSGPKPNTLVQIKTKSTNKA